MYESVLYAEKQLSPSKSQGEAHLILRRLLQLSLISINVHVVLWTAKCLDEITQELDRLVIAEGAGSDVIGDVVLEDRY